MPSVADFIEDHRELLLQRFREEAGRLESAQGLKPSELIDTFPEYLGALAGLSRREGPPGRWAATKKRLEETHVGLRLRLGYNQDEVTSEYVLMGRLIAQLWEALPPGQQPSADDTQRLFDGLDEAMDRAVASFTGYSVEDRQREKRSLRRLDALAPKALSRDEKDLHAQLMPAVETIQQAVGAAGAELFLATPDGAVLVHAVATGLCPRVPEPVRVDGNGPAFLARLAHSEEPLVLAHAQESPPEVREGLGGSTLTTLLGLRLWPHGQLLGVLYVGLTEARPIEPQAKRYFETLVEYLSGILDRALLFGELRDAHDRLSATELRHRLAIEAATDAIWDWNLTTQALSWNEGVQRLFGYPREEVGPDVSWWYEHIHPDDRERVVRGIHAAIDGGQERWRDEYRFLQRSGTPVWVMDQGIVARDAAGRGIRMVGAMQDLTERKQAEQERARLYAALSQSEDRLRLTVAAADLGTWDFNPLTGELRWDERCKVLFGLPPDAAVTWETFLAGIHPEDRARTEDVVQRALAGEAGGVYAIEYRTVGRDGVERWLSAHGRAFFDDGGQAVRFVGTVMDITGRKQLDDALRAREEELRRRAEFEERLIGIVSHDLRNPLNAVALSAGTMLRRADLDDRVRRGLGRILDATERANRMIRDLLDFTQARLGGGLPIHRQRVDFDSFVRQVADEVRLATPEREVAVVTGGTGEGEWDADRLAQVLTNLMTNALHYSPPGTPIRVETRTEDAHVELSVHNEGTPIQPEVLPSLFQPMKRGAEGKGSAYAGLGLGLYIVQSLVRAHGGDIAVRSVAEEGTTFTVRLPREAPTASS